MAKPVVIATRDLSGEARTLAASQGKPRGASRLLPWNWGEWMGPGVPLEPAAPPEVAAAGPRQFDYRIGRNLTVAPRTDEPRLTAFSALRELAETYDVAALCIGHIQRIVSGRRWDIQSRAVTDGKAKAANEAVIAGHRAFWERPDRINTWDEWVKMALYEVLTIDALPLYLHPTLGGTVGAVEIVAGDTIKPLVDIRGIVPLPPMPAYQQVIMGVAYDSYTRDQLLYGRMNPRATSAYGFSPLERCVIGINRAVRKQLQELAHFTDSNIPAAIFPIALGNATVEQIREFNEWLDAELVGLPEKRSKMIAVPVPGTSSSQARPYEFRPYDPTREPDEWELKIVCASFGVQPSEIGFTADVNRATSQGQENAEQRGLEAYFNYIAGLVNRIIRDSFGDPDSQFVWLDNGPSEDVERDARVDQMRLFTGGETVNSLREGNGQDPVEGGDEAFIMAGQTPILVRDLARASEKSAAPAPAPVIANPAAKPKPAEKAEMQKLATYVAKRGSRRPFVADHLSPEFAAAVQAVADTIGPSAAVAGGWANLDAGDA